jgi:transposase
VLTFSPATRVFVCMSPLDMRGSFDALAGAVRRLGLDPTDGHLYLFLNRRRRTARAVWFDGSGWCVPGKRLETGGFQIPVIEPTATQVQVDGAALAAFFAGIDFTATRHGWVSARRRRNGDRHRSSCVTA